jgi:hypothetical protein
MTNEQMQLFEIDGGVKELDAEGVEIVNCLRNLRSEIKALVALEANSKARLLKYLDGCEYATMEGKPVAKVTTVISERPDLEALRANPIYAQAMKQHVVSGEYTKVTLL